MTELSGIVVTGASGRMGRMLIEVIRESGKARLSGALEAPGHDWVGKDLGACLGEADYGVIVSDDPVETFATAKAVVDFTAPAATVAFAGLAAQARAVHVIGTTGLGDDDIAAIGRAAHHATIIRAGNMSLGVNLMQALVEQVARALDESFDIEIS